MSRLVLKIVVTLGMLVGALSGSFPVWAGQQCKQDSLPASRVQWGVQTAVGLQRWLDNSGAQVAVIARQGQDLSAYGVHYSHAAFAVRDPQSGQWRVFHELNECAQATSALYVQGLANFYFDTPVSYDTAIVIPNPAAQSRLLEVLFSSQKLFVMHSPRYNVVANPFATQYQNSNGWVVEVFASAVSPIELLSREQAQNWLKAQAYEPSRIRVSVVERLLGGAFQKNLSFSDQAADSSETTQVWVNTGDSVLRFMADYSVDKSCHTDFLPVGVCILKGPALSVEPNVS